MGQEFSLGVSLEELDNRLCGTTAEGVTSDVNLQEIVDKVDQVDVVSDEKNILDEVVSELIPVVPCPMEIFPQGFSEMIKKISVSTNVDAEVCVGAALAVIGAAIGNTVRVSPKSGWNVPLFIWMIIVAISGYGKTHGINIFVETIDRLQAKAYKKYQEEIDVYLEDMERYKKDKKAGKLPRKPVLRQFKVSDTTIEGLADVMENAPRGVLVHQDELSGFILGLNQYKGGKGNDRQHILELFNCGSWKIDRKSGSRLILNTGASIVGGLQPQVMPKIFGTDSFDDGLLPRFSFVVASNKTQRFSSVGITKDDLIYWENLVSWCYGIELEKDANGFVKPQILILSSEALDMWAAFHNELHETAAFLPIRLKVFIPKLITYSLKYMGILHVLYSFETKTINHVISVETVTNAIRLTKFYAGQVATLIKQYDKPVEAFSEYDTRIVQTLDQLRKETENGKLSLSRIAEGFNMTLPERLKIKNNKAIGTILRKLGLETRQGTGGIYFLIWEEEKIKKLLRSTSTLSPLSTTAPSDINLLEGVL